MPWSFPWSDNIKKRACRYLLQRYLGQFLKEKLTLEQLNIDIYEGTGEIKDILLDVEALNETAAANNLPLEFVDGYIGAARLSVPWSALLTSSSRAHFSGLVLTLRPRAVVADGVMFDSMLDSMCASTIDMAKECLSSSTPSTPAQSADIVVTDARDDAFDGIEALAKAIDAVLTRICVSLVDVTLRLEHVDTNNNHMGSALEMRIASAEYVDEAGQHATVAPSDGVSCKQLTVRGVRFYSDEFGSLASDAPDMTLSGHLPATFTASEPSSLAATHGHTNTHTATELDECFSACVASMSEHFAASECNAAAVLLAECDGETVFRCQLKLDESMTVPKISLQVSSGQLSCLITPHQLRVLCQLAEAFSHPDQQEHPATSAGNKSYTGELGDGDCVEGSGVIDGTSVGRPKPMTRDDYQLIERQLISANSSARQLPAASAVTSHRLLSHGWSGTDFEDREEYLPMYRAGMHLPGIEAESVTSGADVDTMSVSSASASVFSEASRSDHSHVRAHPIYQKYRRRTRKDHTRCGDIGDSETFRVRFQFSSAVVCLLHRDVLTIDGSTNVPTSESCQKLNSMAEVLMCGMRELCVSDAVNSVCRKCRSLLLQHCPVDHISVLAFPVTLKFSERSPDVSTGDALFSASVELGCAQVVECLPRQTAADAEYTELLVFDRGADGANSGAAVSLSVSRSRSASVGRLSPSFSTLCNVSLKLAAGCSIEVDPSLVDRISALLFEPTNQRSASRMATPSSRPTGQSADLTNQMCFDRAIGSTAQSCKYIVEVSAPSLLARLRFPVANLCASHDSRRPPWWRQQLRSDSLLASFQQLQLSASWGSSTSTTTASLRLQLVARQLQLFFICGSCCEDQSHRGARQRHLLLQALSGVCPDSGEDSVRMLRVVITVQERQTGRNCALSPCTLDLAEDVPYVGHPTNDTECFTSSTLDSIGVDDKFGPFGRRRVVFDGDDACLSQADTQDSDSSPGGEEDLVVVADRAQVNGFIETTLSRCWLSVELSAPVLQARLPDKHTYELLYNRLCNDLALWEPHSPLAAASANSCYSPTAAVDDQQLLDDPFTMCRSAAPNNAGLDDSHSDDAMFHSVYEQHQRQWRRQRRQAQLLRYRQSNLSCLLRVGRGAVTLHTACMNDTDTEDNENIGEIRLLFEGGTVFAVSGYAGIPSHGYVCVSSDTVQLYHQGCVAKCQLSPQLPAVDSAAPYLDRILCSESPVSANSDSTPALAVSVKYTLDCSDNVKTFKVAVGLDRCLAHYVPAAFARQLIVPQLMDFFNVTDIHVPGYWPPAVATQLHMQVTRSSLQYRPDGVPFVYRLSCASLTVSSHLVATAACSPSVDGRLGQTSAAATTDRDADMSVLRVILEDSGVHVAPSGGNEQAATAARAADAGAFVRVVACDLLELSVRTCGDGGGGLSGTARVPAAEWGVSVNHIRLDTCADSLCALLRLVRHLSTDVSGGNVDASSENVDVSGENIDVSGQDLDVSGKSVDASGHLASMSDGRNRVADEESSLHNQGGLQSLLEDAMQETTKPHRFRDRSENSVQNPVEVFFFPNEAQMAPASLIDSQFRYAKKEKSIVGGMSSLRVSDFSTPESSALMNTAIDEDDFCVLERDIGVGIRSRSGEPQVRCLIDPTAGGAPWRLVDNFLAAPVGRCDVLRAPATFPVPRRRLTLRRLCVSWRIYGGCDFAATSDSRDEKENASSSCQRSPSRPLDRVRLQTARDTHGDVRVRLLSSPMTGEHRVFFNQHSLHQIPAHAQFGTLATSNVQLDKQPRSPGSRQELSQTNHNSSCGGAHRNTRQMMELKLFKVRCQLDRYPADTEQSIRLVLAVRNVEILDRISTSNINKFLYQNTSDSGLRQSSANMVLVKALVRRPEHSVAMEECDVRVSLCPVRLNVDQDALFFLRDFCHQVATLSSVDAAQSSNTTTKSGAGSLNTPCLVSAPSPLTSPVKSVSAENSQDCDHVRSSAPLSASSSSSSLSASASATPSTTAAQDRSGSPMYFRSFTFSPEVLVRIDYGGKRVDIEQLGPVMGLIVGLGQLNCCQIKLRRVCHRSGLLGYERLLNHVLNEWLTDIRRNQLPCLLGGIGPLHCFLQLFQGVRDLLWLPIEQYRQDGRIVKGLQRGANSFSTSTAMAVLELSSRLVGYIQSMSELAYDLLSPGPTVGQQRRIRRRRRNRQQRHVTIASGEQPSHSGKEQPPHDLREGVANAYQLVKEGLGDTAHLLVRVATTEHDQKGISGAVGGVLRQLPPTVVAPLMLASEATGTVLGGMRNQLVPEARREALDKWKVFE